MKAVDSSPLTQQRVHISGIQSDQLTTPKTVVPAETLLQSGDTSIHSQPFTNNELTHRRTVSQPTEIEMERGDVEEKNKNAIEMENFVEKRIKQPWQAPYQDSFREMNKFPQRMKVFKEFKQNKG